MVHSAQFIRPSSSTTTEQHRPSSRQRRTTFDQEKLKTNEYSTNEIEGVREKERDDRYQVACCCRRRMLPEQPRGFKAEQQHGRITV